MKESKLAAWRRRSFEVITSDVVARPIPGSAAPREWAPHLRQLVAASRLSRRGAPVVDAHERLLRQRRNPHRDGLKRLGRRDRPVVFCGSPTSSAIRQASDSA